MTDFETKIINFSEFFVAMSAILHGRIGYDLGCLLVAVSFTAVVVFYGIKSRMEQF